MLDAVDHSIAYSNGDYKNANRLHKKLHKLYNQVKEQNHVDIFSELLDHSNESVRLWSAIFTLKYDPEIAEKVLKKLSKESNIKMTA